MKKLLITLFLLLSIRAESFMLVDSRPISSGSPSALTVESVSTSFQDASSGTFTITKPTGVANNDILVAFIAKYDDPTITGPSGWIQAIQSNDTSGNDRSAGIWYKVITDASGEPASYSWTATANVWAGTIMRISGSNTSSPIDAAAAVDGIGAVGVDWVDTTDGSPSVTTVTNNAMAISSIMLYAVSVGATSFAPPSGYDERSDNPRPSVAETVATKTIASAGATGVVLFTGTGETGNEEWFSMTIAIKPAS